MRLSFFSTIWLLTFLFVFTRISFAADPVSLGQAMTLPISGSNIPDGSIISSVNNSYSLSTAAYDPLMIGVVSYDPAVILEDTTDKQGKPVISIGKAYVRVSSLNGAIKPGDYITSSSTPGVGEKATENGYILGTAVSGYSAKDTKATGLILVTLHPHFGQLSTNIVHNLFSSLRYGLSSAFLTPLGTFRYFISGFIALLSFVIGFQFFARVSRSGVESIGRNPLAGKLIMASIIFNVILTLAIMIFGVAIAYLILVL